MFGLWIVVDFFEDDGWEMILFGVGLLVDDVVELVD